MEELIELTDPRGIPTGQLKSRDKLVEGVDWHTTVHVWIINSTGKLLLQKRSAWKRSPERWDISAAGHIPAGERAKLSARRELEEELGVKVNEAEIHSFKVIANPNHCTNHQVFWLLLEQPAEKFKLQKSEVSEVRWIDGSTLAAELKRNPEHFVEREKEWAEVVNFLKEIKA